MPGPTAPTDPIRDREAIARIKENLANKPRDLALFCVGINTAFRISDILNLNVGDVRDKEALSVKEKKTGKRRIVPLNPVVISALKPLIEGRDDSEPLFIGEKRGTRITPETAGRLWKRWAKDAGLRGNYSSHSGRKTALYNWHTRGNVPLATLMVMVNHSSEAQTARYIGITREDIAKVYELTV